MTDRYTAADFERIAEAWDLQEEGGHKDGSKIIRAALRIASRVMADGVIEGACSGGDHYGGMIRAEAAIIRAALLEDTGT